MKRKFHIPSTLKNKYILSLIVFGIWLLFFDQNDLISQMQLRYEIYQLEQQKEFYIEQIEITKNDLDELLTSKEQLEKFAREKYLMKRPEEDLFVIVPEPQD